MLVVLLTLDLRISRQEVKKDQEQEDRDSDGDSKMASDGKSEVSHSLLPSRTHALIPQKATKKKAAGKEKKIHPSEQHESDDDAEMAVEGDAKSSGGACALARHLHDLGPSPNRRRGGLG